MQFQGERTFSMPQGALFARLADATFLMACIPDASPAGEPTPDSAPCAVRPGFSFVRGSLDVVVNVVSRQPPTSVKCLLTSKGIGSAADVETALTLTPADGTTKVAWTATIVKLGGLLKAIPAGLIRGAAQKVIDDVWAGVEAKLAEPFSGEPTATADGSSRKQVAPSPRSPLAPR
jgi:carbon monoxide dehydrogenase subunit G